MKESVARSRLKEYSDKHPRTENKDDDDRTAHSSKFGHKNPLEISRGPPGSHRGTAALEIANTLLGASDLLEQVSRLDIVRSALDTSTSKSKYKMEHLGKRSLEEEGYMMNRKDQLGNYSDEDSDDDVSQDTPPPSTTRGNYVVIG